MTLLPPAITVTVCPLLNSYWPPTYLGPTGYFYITIVFKTALLMWRNGTRLRLNGHSSHAFCGSGVWAQVSGSKENTGSQPAHVSEWCGLSTLPPPIPHSPPPSPTAARGDHRATQPFTGQRSRNERHWEPTGKPEGLSLQMRFLFFFKLTVLVLPPSSCLKSYQLSPQLRKWKVVSWKLKC